mgnify:CR=1 FL=1
MQDRAGRCDGIAEIVTAAGTDRSFCDGLVALHKYSFCHNCASLLFHGDDAVRAHGSAECAADALVLVLHHGRGITLFVECAIGFDVGGGIMFALSPVKTFIGSALRVILAACCVVLVSALTAKFKEKKWRSFLLSALLPVFNTGFFLIAFITLFNSLLHEWASAQSATVVSYIFLGLVGVNFKPKKRRRK